MKLDNIIYDVDSLSNALAEQWRLDSDVFASIYPSDTATALINGMAAYSSMLQYCVVSALANCYTTTAFSDAAVYQLADTLGNKLHGNVSSQVIVNIRKNNFKGKTLTVPAYSKFEINGKSFFNPYAIILPAVTASSIEVKDITLIQGEIIEVNKTTSGIENEKFYFSSDFKASPNYIQVFVDGAEWNVVDSFLSYDKSYVTNIEDMNSVVFKTDPDGRAYVKVGDGQLGSMPLSGSVIQIRYCSNDGADGNIDEKGLTGTLTSQLLYVDNQGNSDNLDLTLTTTTTAYGGFSKQSVEMLRLTSPWVFASGHRAIRRQDYNALLQNQCGYLTSQVWGEYEQANKIGTYDCLMMNMVYYTGIKSFETYPDFKLDSLTSIDYYNGALYSNSGFYGSYNISIIPAVGSQDKILAQDTGAKGILFINRNDQDPRDSLLPDWIWSKSNGGVEKIKNAGSNYQINDEIRLYYEKIENDEIIEVATNMIAVIEEIDSTGAVEAVKLESWESISDNISGIFYDREHSESTRLELLILSKKPNNDVTVGTNDEITEEPISNAMSNKENIPYRSTNVPSLQRPVQIYLNYEEEIGLAGIKFKAYRAGSGLAEYPFIGTMAMFGSNGVTTDLGENIPPSYENVRNSDAWDVIITRKEFSTPLENGNDNWTDWIATNCFTGKKDRDNNPVFNRYKYYVIEIYSKQVTTIEDTGVAFDCMKILYEKDASELFYTENSEIRLKLPVAGDPGPGTEAGYLPNNFKLIDNKNFYMYNYSINLNGITAVNGYEDNDILFYTSTGGSKFKVKVTSVANNTYDIMINGSTVPAGSEKIDMTTGQPFTDKLYTYTLDPSTNRPDPDYMGEGYTENDIIIIKDKEGNLTDLKLRVTSTNANGGVLNLAWLNNESLHTPLDKEEEYEYSDTECLTSAGTPGSGVGLKLKVVSKIGTNGEGATILITSDYNLEIDASFKGNRIDTADVNRYDEPIIKKFNHFTTYLEFVQPEMHEVYIHAQVAIKKDSPIASGIVIQNIKTNIQKLFELTPDYIGKDLKLSDIYKAITDTDYVSWCKVLHPLDNQNIDINEIMICQDIDIDEVIDTYE